MMIAFCYCAYQDSGRLYVQSESWTQSSTLDKGNFHGHIVAGVLSVAEILQV